MVNYYNPEEKQKVQPELKNKYFKHQHKYYALAVVFLPLIFTFLAVTIAFSILGVHSIDIWLFVIMTILSVIGIEMGYHRYFSHCSFQTNTILRATLAILGSTAGMGPPIYWVAHHRRHHQYSDKLGDPHSPNFRENGIKNKLHGLWHAHIGWVLDLEISNAVLYAKDLLRDPIVSQINRYYFLWLFLPFAIPAVIEGIITKSWVGLISGFLWGGIIRFFVAQQMIFCVGSLCHLYGARPFKNGDGSSNIAWLALPTMGGSWHNNHHAFPNAATNQLEWWQIDFIYWLIYTLEKIGLVWDVKVPTRVMIEAKKAN